MANCKLIHRFIITALTVIVMQTSTCNAGCASDGGGEIPPPAIPDTTAGMFVQESLKSADAQPAQPQKPPKIAEVPMETAPDKEAAPEKSAEKTEVQKAEEEVKPPLEAAVQPEQKPQSAPEQEGGFMAAVMKMLGVLVKTIFLILLLFAGVLLYKYLKNRKLPGAPKAEHKITEPQTVSEAVSSYVRHKIKKNA